MDKMPDRRISDQACRALVNRYITRERIRPGDIAILLGNDTFIEKAGWRRVIAGYPVTACNSPGENAVVVDTIRRFKGLESKVVMLVLTRDLVSSTELLYVATSRARTHLIIIGTDRNIDAARQSG